MNKNFKAEAREGGMDRLKECGRAEGSRAGGRMREEERRRDRRVEG